VFTRRGFVARLGALLGAAGLLKVKTKNSWIGSPATVGWREYASSELMILRINVFNTKCWSGYHLDGAWPLSMERREEIWTAVMAMSIEECRKYYASKQAEALITDDETPQKSVKRSVAASIRALRTLGKI
jgi:hypothetical protein